ncbi:MAG: PIN domain-containing protein [Actinobacteria bacterium]|jgi:predicted nucleic acid-binding protein|nr:PIN domain-containing protein [Actinomycetota bacterium]
MRALLDTSFFVATESGRPLGEMENVTETEVSVVTLAELTVGVLVASDDDRSARMATLSAVESTWDPLPIDAEVSRQFARIAAALRVNGRRVPILDALVAATAIVEQIPVVTQDNDYEAIPGVEVIRV